MALKQFSSTVSLLRVPPYIDGYQTSKWSIIKNMHTATLTTTVHISSKYLIYCILGNEEIIKYHIFISVVVIELSVKSFKHRA